MTSAMNLVFLGVGWVAYASLHSLLAALGFKTWVTRRWPGFAPYFRLAYNLQSVFLLLPLLWATYALPGDWLWRWSGGWAWLANGLAFAALAGFLFSSGSYDMGEFLGLTPLRKRRRDAAEHDGFRLSPLHRHVRHPWYALGLVLIWTRDMNGPLLVSALAITLYLIIGSRLEERKLEAHFGAAYREYRERVPGLVPLPWKSLSADQAEELVRRTRKDARVLRDTFEE
jgi:protein-S-isoprenylcysteine O-methyltransferase Ste14